VLAGALALCAVCVRAIGAEEPAAAEPIDARIRIAWGGGEARAWQGAIRVSAGTLSEVKPLGLETDAPGSLLPLDDAAIRIVGRAPRSYDGCDLRVQAPADAKLIVQLWDERGAALPPREIPLARAIHDFTQFELDEHKNRLFAQRSPGDGLRVSFAQESLVFAPRDTFELEVEPRHLGLASNTNYVLSAALGPARTEENNWHAEREVHSTATGGAPAIALAVPLPEQEGVYDLRLSLLPATLLPKRLANPLVRGKPLATRKVQLVVVSPVRQAVTHTAAWQNVLDFDPANPKWWEPVTRLPTWTRLPTTARHIANGPAGTRNHLGKNWVELPPGAWQAYPLPIPTPGTPHLIGVEYPSDLAQTLAISLIEPNAAGFVGPIGVDSGIDVPPPSAGHKAAARRHRLICWPQTRTPYLLLVNRRDDAPAVFGKIDVQSASAPLPPLSIPPPALPGRILAAYYDKPLFTKNFSGTEGIDPVSRRGLDDWLTFSAAAERLLETLEHTGYNALVLTAASDGSAIYPSQHLQPTPRYDSGAFFESGQDPVRKDVLELLFRLCDRRGIVLIPAVQFASPLAELEVIRVAAGPEAVGLEPTGADGLAWRERSGGQSGVYYNALDERVQQAMTAVVAELAQRYGQHASFGGVGVQLSTEGYALLPDNAASLDDTTFGRFLSETESSLPASSDSPLVARWNFIHGPGIQKWTNWRTARMTALYRRMRDTVIQQRPGAKLYLTTGNLLGGRTPQTLLRPELPARNTVAELLPQGGLDLEQLTDDDIIVPRPQRVVAASSPALHDQEQHWNRQAALDAIFAPAAHGAAQHLLLPASQRLAEFDAASPFGADKTRTLLLSQLVPADAAARERFAMSLARLDATLMIDGGWLLPLGQEAALAPLVKVYRRLPAEPFETFSRQAQPQELVVRSLSKGSKTYFYVVNPNPWPLRAQVQFSGPQPLRMMAYSDERPATVQPTAGGATWTVDLEPFDVVGGEVAGGPAKITHWTTVVPPDTVQTLGEQLSDIKRRAYELRMHPRPMTLANASFEAPQADGAIPGWVHARGDGMTVEIDRTLGSGSSSALHLVSRGANSAVWVRSDVLPTPATGRLEMNARLRIANPEEQPQLRLAIEGKLDGQVYYRRLNVGAREREADLPPQPLASEWKTYEMTLANLPLAGLTDLRLGFDLMSEGEVWIDDVQVFDLLLESSEYDELLKGSVTARWQAEHGRLNDCRLFIEDYWPSFLRRNVQAVEPRQLAPVVPPGTPAAAATTQTTIKAAETADSPPEAGASAPGAASSTPPRSSEKRRGWWPTWMKWR
jgi:hypothetical protein